METPIVAIAELNQYLDQKVRIRGWVYGRRSSGKLTFLLTRDGTGTVQATVEAQYPEAFAATEHLGQESSVILTGTIVANDREDSGVEMSVLECEVIQNVSDYPISRKAHGTDFLMSHRHLWLRAERQTAILRIRHTIIQAARRFFDDDGYTLIDTPILAPGAAEGAGTLFNVDYFGDEVHLAQTGQLYAEAAAMALGKVYCFGPTFRAEKSKTRRHLTEFWMIEPEVAFFELPDVEHLAERFITCLVKAVLDKNRKELALLDRDVERLEKIDLPFPRVTYSEAVETLRSDAVHEKLLAELAADKAKVAEDEKALKQLESQLAQTGKAWKKEKLEQEMKELQAEIKQLKVSIQNRPQHIDDARNFQWGKDLGGDEETILSRMHDRPLIVTRYPRGAKAFYMKQDPEDERVVLNLDVLAPEGYGEIVGGSQREDSLERLLERMAEEGLGTEDYEWYLDLRRFGTVPHGGFGLGIERTVSWICGLKHIRETNPFPRLMGRMTP